MLDESWGRRTLAESPAEKALFLNFADIQPTRAGILQFVRLEVGVSSGLVISTPGLVGISPDFRATGRGSRWHRYGFQGSVAEWTRHSTQVRAVVDLWHQLGDGHQEELAGTVVWRRKEVVYRTGGERESDSVVASDDVRPELFRSFAYGDRLAPGWQVLADMLNPSVQEHALPTLVWDAVSERLELRNIADGLIGTVWTQFAEAVGQRLEFERCGYCGRWFELEAHTRRQREFCTTRCRVYHFRARRKLAETRRASGRTVDEIAAELDVDPALVNRWFTSREESRTQLRTRLASRAAAAVARTVGTCAPTASATQQP